MSDESEQINLAKAYVALSNAHRIDLILPMFARNGTYHSVHVGEFKGRDSIGEMMSGFFERFPDVIWEVTEYRHSGTSAVSFDFVMNATEAATGNHLERRGEEQIDFTDDGLISRLEVRPR